MIMIIFMIMIIIIIIITVHFPIFSQPAHRLSWESSWFAHDPPSLTSLTPPTPSLISLVTPSSCWGSVMHAWEIYQIGTSNFLHILYFVKQVFLIKCQMTTLFAKVAIIIMEMCLEWKQICEHVNMSNSGKILSDALDFCFRSCTKKALLDKKPLRPGGASAASYLVRFPHPPTHPPTREVTSTRTQAWSCILSL